MKIATVTPNAAIDQTIRVDNFQPGTVNRGQAMHILASGKGVNVASFLADYGYVVAVTGYLGQDNSDEFEHFFALKHIDDHFVRIPGRTRINVKVVDEANQQTTDINTPGLTPPPEAEEQLFQAIEQLVSTCDWFVLSSSLPPGAPTTLYATIITRLKQHRKGVVLDTSGEALAKGVQAGPTIIKPNIDELQQLAGQSLTNESAVQQAARELLNEDTRLVVVSMGKGGALFIDQATTLLAVPPPVTLKRTAGAGDAMVAGLLAGQIQGSSLADCARLATAFSLGAITRVGSPLPAQEILQEYFDQVFIYTR